MKHFFALVLLLLSIGPLWPGESYSIVVRKGDRQTFAGFGASQVAMEFGHFPPEPFRSAMADLVYRELKAKVLRLWVQSGPTVSIADMKTAFAKDYIKSGVISMVMERGVKTLLLAPARGMEAPKDSLREYAVKIAQFIFELKKEHGIEINVTGIANEPEGWSGEQLRDCIKFMRTELDSRGLVNVGIIAPENPSANEILQAQLDIIYADKAAWDSLLGIASHSYNMAARDSEADRTFGKQYWMTEAADDGNEQGEDENRAASTSGRFLNDLNHGVTHWIFFKGFSYSPDVTQDDYTASRIMQYDAATAAIVTHLKYYYLKGILSTLDAGAVLRRCESGTEADMVYSYGQKPRVCAAAGVNPDGTWGIAVVNLTGVSEKSDIAQWYPGSPLDLSIHVEELNDSGKQRLRLFRCKAGQHFVDVGEVTVERGVVGVTVSPRELICLRSVAVVK